MANQQHHIEFQNQLKKMPLDTLVVHAGVIPDPSTGAIMTPIYQTSTYVQEGIGNHKGYEYSRTRNPTRTALESALALVEGADHAFAFASGCAATTTAVHLLKAGDHLICSDDVYGGTYRIFELIMKNLGIEVDFCDLAGDEGIAPFLKPNTKMVWIETPSNPTMKTIDIKQVADQSHKNRADCLVVADNTFMTSIFQRPLALGADIVLHSTTKYFGGHSDVIGGALIFNNPELVPKLHFLQNSMGAVPGPFDSFLILRGIKTLALRMRKHEENANGLAQFLENHPLVERVTYPGLTSFKYHQRFKKQTSGFGGMMTLNVKGNLAQTKNFLESTRLFSLAESLGGVESLIEHPALMTHASLPVAKRKNLGIDDNLVRLSVGIEDLNDLKNDLDAALKKGLG